MTKTAEKSLSVFRNEDSETFQRVSINIGGNVTSGRDTNVESSIKPDENKKKGET